jgi:hypothetical protein
VQDLLSSRRLMIVAVGLTLIGSTALWTLPFDARYGDGYRLWQALEPDIVFHVASPGFPVLPTQLERYIRDQNYDLVESFVTDGYPVNVWFHPDYHSES